jgi:undecaprenol kinase/diacylglycerol kinase (ATP)
MHALRTERNMQIHLAVTVLVLAAMWWLDISRTERLLVFFAIGLVWAMETLNTAIEAVVDQITSVCHPLAKIAKDAAAGAVLISVITAVIIGLYVFLPPLLNLWNMQ